jgi:toxin ParE1/3/4
LANVIWTPEALRQLEAILDYLADVAPDYAEVLSLEIEAAVDSLTQFPQIGRIVPEFQRDDLREIILDNYRIVYVLRVEGIRIVSMFHAAMDVATRLRRIDVDN